LLSRKKGEKLIQVKGLLSFLRKEGLKEGLQKEKGFLIYVEGDDPGSRGCPGEKRQLSRPGGKEQILWGRGLFQNNPTWGNRWKATKIKNAGAKKKEKGKDIRREEDDRHGAVSFSERSGIRQGRSLIESPSHKSSAAQRRESNVHPRMEILTTEEKEAKEKGENFP